MNNSSCRFLLLVTFFSAHSLFSMDNDEKKESKKRKWDTQDYYSPWDIIDALQDEADGLELAISDSEMRIKMREEEAFAFNTLTGSPLCSSVKRQEELKEVRALQEKNQKHMKELGAKIAQIKNQVSTD